MGFSTATLAGLGYFVITKYMSMKPELQILTSMFILILSIGMVVMLKLLEGWKNQANGVSEFNYMRSREIEVELGMCKNLRHLARRDDFGLISEENKKRIYDYYGKEYWDYIRRNPLSDRRGNWYVSRIFWILEILWLIMAVIPIILLVLWHFRILTLPL